MARLRHVRTRRLNKICDTYENLIKISGPTLAYKYQRNTL